MYTAMLSNRVRRQPTLGCASGKTCCKSKRAHSRRRPLPPIPVNYTLGFDWGSLISGIAGGVAGAISKSGNQAVAAAGQAIQPIITAVQQQQAINAQLQAQLEQARLQREIDAAQPSFFSQIPVYGWVGIGTVGAVLAVSVLRR